MPDQQILAASHKPPQNAPMPDMPLDLTGQLAQDLLDLTARLGARAEQDPFGNPVLLVALAISRRMDTHDADRGRHRRADPPPARRRLRRPRAAAGRLCRRHRHRSEHRRAGRPGAAPAAARSERQPGALGRVSRAGGTHALRRRVHRASDLRAAGRGRPRPGGDRQRAAHDAGPAVAPAAADHAGRRVRPGRRRHRQRPRRDRPVQRGPAVGRALRLAGPLDRAGAAPGHPVELGRLRHRRAHRYRLVGHAAAAAGDEAPATRAAARPARRPAGDRGARGARRHGAGDGRRAACALSRRAGPAARRRLRPGAGATGATPR